MIESIDTSLIDWSRAQFCDDSHVPLDFCSSTLGLAVVMGIMETLYYKTGNEFWKKTCPVLDETLRYKLCHWCGNRFDSEFEFGTNQSNYSPWLCSGGLSSVLQLALKAICGILLWKPHLS